MVYANRGPEPTGRGSMGGSYSPPVRLTPEQQAKANQNSAIFHEKRRQRAEDKANGIMHPSDPETKIHWVSKPEEHLMSRSEQERRVKDGSLPPVFGRLLARVDHMRAYPEDPYGPLRVEPLTGPVAKTMQVNQSEPIQVASARVQGHGIVRPQTPQQQLQHQFETTVAARAQGLLKANKDRLDGEQLAYLQDHNPKGDRWSHLWQVAAQRREFQTQQSNLQQQYELTVNEINMLGDMADGTGLMSTPQERQNSAKHKRLLVLSEQKNRLEGRIGVAKQMQVSLEYAYPALAAVRSETGANPEDIEKVQKRLPDEFDGIRGNIDKLGGEIRKNPSTALLFDSVVTGELRHEWGGAHGHQQRQDLMRWLEGERANKERLSQLGQAVGGGLFLASFVPQLRGLSPLLKILGTGTLSATFAYDLPDLLLLDAAAQSGRGGAGTLTSQSPEEARFNLVMGYANVALAGLDVAAEVGVIRLLERLVGQGVLMGVQVSRQVWREVMSLAKLGEAGIEKARVLLAKVKGISGAVLDEVMHVLSPSQEVAGIGKMSRQEMRGQTAGVTTEEAVQQSKAGQKGKKKPSSDYRKNFEDSNGSIPEDHQVHHLATQASFNKSELAQAWKKLGIADVHEAANLEALPTTKKAYDKSSIKIQHSGSHPKWNTHVDDVLEKEQERLKGQYGSLDKVPSDVMEQTKDKVMKHLREDLLDKDLGIEKGWIKHTKNGMDKLSQSEISNQIG